MRRFALHPRVMGYAIAIEMLLAATCKFELGDSPVGPPVTQNGQEATKDSTVTFEIYSSHSQLKANNTDTAVITAVLLNKHNNPLTGDTVYFSSSTGIIEPYSFVNFAGKASALFYSSSSANGACTVSAVTRKYRDTVSMILFISGMSMGMSVDKPALKIAEAATITATVTDVSNKPVSGEVVFTTSNGIFLNNEKMYRAQLDANGKATVKVTSPSPGTVWVRAASFSISDSIGVRFDTSAPVDTAPTTVEGRQFHLYSSRSQLKADNSDTATITALLINDKNNPATGDTILFSCNIGVIESREIIDASGRARVTLRSSPINGICVVKATSAKTKDTASTMLIFSGVRLRLESDVTDLKINDYAAVTAYLTDGSGNAIGGDTVVFTAKGGLFPNGATAYRGMLDPTGKASVKVTSGSAGTARIYAMALNTSDSLSIVFTNNALKLEASKSKLVVGGADESQLTATYVDGNGQPKANEQVVFSTNAGAITKSAVTTDGNGKAYSSIKSAPFAATATVVASASAGNAVIKIAFLSAVPRYLNLTVSPDNIGVNGGTACLMATVQDTNKNMVTGADVNFRILKGPGGGEYIDKPVVTTQNGIARAQILAGSIPSQYRAVTVIASTGDGIADTVKLTISGEPYAISVSRPQSDTVQVGNAGSLDESTFDYFVGAVVVDINGNPVADGTRVNFSCVVSGMAVHPKCFIKWAGLGSIGEKYAVMGYRTIDIPFEDINNNLTMDENDLKLDYNDAVARRGDDANGDGRCDFDPAQHDLWIDFNENGKVDIGMSLVPKTVFTPITKDTSYLTYKDTLINDTIVSVPKLVTKTDTIGYKKDTVGYAEEFTGCEPFIYVDGQFIYADLYPNGIWDTDELIRDVATGDQYDAPASGDRRWWEHECLPFWFRQRFDFVRNDFGISVTTSAPCKNGVAYAKLTYPRQLARRLFVTVNGEANGVSDRTGERFVLPVIVGGRR